MDTLKLSAVTTVIALSSVAGLGGRTIFEHPVAGEDATETFHAVRWGDRYRK